MKQTGIWIDSKRAYIITFKDGEMQMKTVTSGKQKEKTAFRKPVEKGGAREIIKDRKILEQKRQFQKNYFKSIVPYIKDTSIVLFGPAEMPEKFAMEMKKAFPLIYKNIVEVIKADSMSKNQIVAMVREYYRN